MSAAVKIGSKLPGDAETNGLDSLVDSLVEDPETVRVALVWFDVHHVTIDTDSGDHIPTVRFRRFEPVGDASEAPQAVRDLVAKAMEKRTGRRPIPFEIVTVDEERYSDTLDESDE